MKRWQTIAIAAAGIAAGAYVYLNWETLPLGFLHSSRSSESSGVETPVSSGHPAKMNWQTSNRPDDGFKIEFPAEPKEVQVPAYNEAGSSEPIKMLFASPDGDTTFALSWADNPPVSRISNRLPDKTLDMARDGMLVRTRTTLTNESRILSSGFPARDIAARNGDGGILDARLIFTGDRLYTLMALFPSSQARREQDVVRFFNSFAASKLPGTALPTASGP